MDNKKARALLEKYKQGTCSEDELALLETWYNQMQPPAVESQPEAALAQAQAEVWNRMQPELQKRSWPWKSMAAAAAVLLLGISGYWLAQQPSETAKPVYQAGKPGQYTAIMTSADGQRFMLTKRMQELAHLTKDSESGMDLYTMANLDYSLTLANRPNFVMLNDINTVETPMGGNVQVLLADGTKVWLNAGSTLSYPINFDRYAKREVCLIGEAYFEVEKNPKKTFTVKSENQDVNVLGTKFNVHAYPNQEDRKVTLLEGSVEVVTYHPKEATESRVILKPSEELEIRKNKTDKHWSDVQKTLAWKEGQFIFNDDSLRDIMAQIARWYAVEVDFKSLPESHYHGQISKQASLTEVLSMLEITGDIGFKVENNQIIAFKK